MSVLSWSVPCRQSKVEVDSVVLVVDVSLECSQCCSSLRYSWGIVGCGNVGSSGVGCG